MGFAEIEHLAFRVRVVMFKSSMGEVDLEDNNIQFPLTWFSESYAKCDYERLYRVWDSGLPSMKGKSLVIRAAEIVTMLEKKAA